MSKTLIVGLQGLRSAAQEERRGEKDPELTQVERSSGHKKRTESGPKDDRGLQEIGEQETRRGPGNFFNNKEKECGQQTANCKDEPGELARGTQEKPRELTSSLCRVHVANNRLAHR